MEETRASRSQKHSGKKSGRKKTERMGGREEKQDVVSAQAAGEAQAVREKKRMPYPLFMILCILLVGLIALPIATNEVWVYPTACGAALLMAVLCIIQLRLNFFDALKPICILIGVLYFVYPRNWFIWEANRQVGIWAGFVILALGVLYFVNYKYTSRKKFLMILCMLGGVALLVYSIVMFQ